MTFKNSQIFSLFDYQKTIVHYGKVEFNIVSADHKPLQFYYLLCRMQRRYRTWSWRTLWSRCGRSSATTRSSTWWTRASRSPCCSSSIRLTSWQQVVVMWARTRCLTTSTLPSASTSSTDIRTMLWSFSSPLDQTVDTRWLSSSRSAVVVVGGSQLVPQSTWQDSLVFDQGQDQGKGQNKGQGIGLGPALGTS